MKKFTLKIIALFLFIGYLLINTGCDLAEKLEPKSFIDVFEDKICDKDWTVDSIRYTRTTESKTLIYDSVKAVGIIRFKRHDDVANEPTIGPTQGLLFHTYKKDGVQRIDTSAWTPQNSGTEIPRFTIVNKFYPIFTSWELSNAGATFDIVELSNNKFRLIRYERIQYNNGQYDGYLRSAIIMHK